MRIIKILLGLGLVITVAGCATQPVEYSPGAPGFLYGLLHGVISPYVLVLSFFTDYRMYAYPNTGVPYDIGFFLGFAGYILGLAADR